ncbi:uncharacterized protein LOC114538133 [Dendronephthya gigantea]|uniref:uncharacterized protein LOC114538133 n=1 Tax=Dendronephthya gigantea TaxID=151771 RepID=UPI0010695DF5|nr:uncharacterized protein LOC114538133 [Dendronephthya gigantea]
MENINKNAAVEFTPNKGSRVCSEHFSVDMMQKVGQRTMLLPYAIPTIFQKSQETQSVKCVEVASKDIASWMSDRDCVSMEEVAEHIVSKDSAGDTTTESVGKVVVQGVTDKVSSCNVSVQGITKEVITDDVIAHGRKRKPSDEDFDEMLINGVSTPKRIHMSHVNHDHTYHISKSPRRMKKHVDNLVNKMTKLQNKCNASKQKTRRLKRKVSTLESVVSELRQSNLINSDCAAIWKQPFPEFQRN